MTGSRFARIVAAASALALAACAGMQAAARYDGATPGTVPGDPGEPSGPMYNGLLPEPWGSTS